MLFELYTYESTRSMLTILRKPPHHLRWYYCLSIHLLFICTTFFFPVFFLPVKPVLEEFTVSLDTHFVLSSRC